ncbi:UNVERIFIED_CONTAM: hypothetical protein RKD43_001529 [Streptomyces graminofaciens]
MAPALSGVEHEQRAQGESLEDEAAVHDAEHPVVQERLLRGGRCLAAVDGRADQLKWEPDHDRREQSGCRPHRHRQQQRGYPLPPRPGEKQRQHHHGRVHQHGEAVGHGHHQPVVQQGAAIGNADMAAGDPGDLEPEVRQAGHDRHGTQCGREGAVSQCEAGLGRGGCHAPYAAVPVGPSTSCSVTIRLHRAGERRRGEGPPPPARGVTPASGPLRPCPRPARWRTPGRGPSPRTRT